MLFLKIFDLSDYHLCPDTSVDMDVVDLLMEDLRRQGPPLLACHKPWSTTQAAERIDQLSGDRLPINHPSHRGSAPSEREIAPPIMPSEHWLADELPCPAPQAKLSQDMLVLGRLPQLPSPQTLWLEPVSHRDSVLHIVVESENSSLAKEHTSRTFANFKKPAILSRSSARACAGEICSSSEGLDPSFC